MKELTPRQRVYCSRACQAKGTACQKRTSRTQTKQCAFCGEIYLFHPEWKKDRNTRYCTRQCKDLHQKVTYLNDGNPSYGKMWTEEERIKHADAIKQYWSDPEHRKQFREKMFLVSQKLGHWPGTDAISREACRQTCLHKYGVKHPWMDAEIRQKCEDTTLQRYGKHTWEIAHDALKNFDTSIEVKVVSVLDAFSVEYMHPYVLSVDDNHREFDFYVPSLSTLIEVDGDYYHANPVYYDELEWNDIQRHTRENDKFKDDMVKKTSLRLLRFWETDVNRLDFEMTLREILWQK